MAADGGLKGLLKTTGGRFGLVCLFVLLLNVPLLMIEGVIDDRSGRFSDVAAEIAEAWGSRQTIIGPVLSVPVRTTVFERVFDPQKKTYVSEPRTSIGVFAVLPDELKIDAVMTPEIRHRGIYNVLVHGTSVRMTGYFTDKGLSVLKEKGEILQDGIRLNVGMDASSVRGNLEMSFAGRPLDLSPSAERRWKFSGVSAPVAVKGMKRMPFSLSFSFNGSGAAAFAPVGRKSVFRVTSPWAHPVFGGAFRPDAPKIDDGGFVAEWNIPYIARGYPQTVAEGDTGLLELKTAEVSLFDPMPVYKRAVRLCNYGLMFAALTFLMMFLLELKAGCRFGSIQYIIAGLAVSVFFLAVLSLAEHISFGTAYLASASVVTLMLSAYVNAAMRSRKAGAVCAAWTAVLYGLLYIMLCSADYALLIGTGILLCALAAAMKATAHSNEDGA